MATWKEKGEVPDSDDDGDFESQSFEHNRDTARPVTKTPLEGRDEESGIIHDTEEPRVPHDGVEGQQNRSRQGTDAVHGASPTTNPVGNADSLPIHALSSPLTDSVFQIPDLEGVLDEELGQRDGAQRSQNGLPLVDDISKSYVQITPQASSQQLCSPDGLPELPSLRKFHHNSRMSTLNLQDSETTPSLHANGSTAQQSEEQTSYPMIRALRHRNPIQLHPYVVENEKYRRTLKARGIAPMRLASSQAEPQHTPQSSPTPDPDFQQEDTPGFGGDTGESQAMDFEYSLPSSSPEQPSGTRSDVQGLTRGGNQEENWGGDSNDEDDEFPDIDELLRSRLDPPVKQVPKKSRKLGRIKSYSHKFKRPVLPRILTQSNKPKPTARHDQVMFDLPASPPTTSSPLHNIPSRRADTSNNSIRSLEPSPIWLSQDEVQLRGIADLPTPSTSALKPPPLPIPLDSDSDDPFASDVESSASSSSSDESLQIRKITRKFRGVLPASHLRLDQNKKLPTTKRMDRDSQSASPVKSMPQRGVALPRTQPVTMENQRSPSATTGANFSFISDGSDEDELSGFVMEDNDASQLESIFDRSRTGYAEEDDRVDAMLPSRKRPSTMSNRTTKKRRLESSSFQRTGSSAYKRQPKITEHLDKAPSNVSTGQSNSARPRRSKKKKQKNAPRMPSPPAIGLLDVADILTGDQTTQPDFIRIAARAARSSEMQGRHKPTGKFFRLATREDTEDVQSVLKDWSSGRFQPKHLPSLDERVQRSHRVPLSRVQSNQQTHFQPAKTTSKPVIHLGESSQAIRRLPVSRRQQSMNNFIRREQSIAAPPRPFINHQANPGSDRTAQRKPRLGNQSARPAQLEALEVEYTKRYPSTTFKSSKRALDALYKKTRKRPIPSANLQLTRFLADEDIVLPSIEKDPGLELSREKATEAAKVRQLPQVQRRQKPTPRRVDVGAAVYRQPSDPLILNYTIPQAPRDGGSESKLRGLAKFGAKYTQNFEILPLPPGVFFHASTFIGSGQLSRFTKRIADHEDSTPVLVSLNLAKTFSWSAWNESVSSEIGLCFDWVLDQLALDDSGSTSAPGALTIDVIMSLCEYTQQSLTFDGPLNETMFLSRMLDILRDFSSRLQVHNLMHNSKVQVGVQVLSKICAMTLRLLSLARAEQRNSALSYDFEAVLKAIASQCAQLLLTKDMSMLRKLYDDLQYLSFRDNGIRNNEYVAEAWVILIKVLGKAKITRGSFWDVVNPLLTGGDIVKVIDAATMEKIWYSMYTLLPLCEFDEHGVVIHHSRKDASFDNWNLPQLLLKRVFSLYTSNPRQSPGFNDYCRSIIGRCHCLVVEWGWWSCSAVIGTIFDFFASHNLAHLRNEEVYTSPLFLEELDQNPSLAIDAEDRCFHIFLKLVALALKRFTTSNDIKSARNLVARLQPNHNRQYPKEESIRQQDLASLRNHHDLLCTLFWASPPSERPSAKMIEQLVERSRSHLEAFRVHCRTRRNMAGFLYSKDTDEKALLPLEEWLQKDVRSLFLQYEGVEEVARKQAVQGATEAQISNIIAMNREKLLDPIIQQLKDWEHDIDATVSTEKATKAFNSALFLEVLDWISRDSHLHTNGLLVRGVKVVEAYLKKIGKLRPSTTGATASKIGDEDSQNTLDAVDVYTLDTTTALKDVHNNFARFASRCLDRASPDRDMASMKYLLGIWAQLAVVFIDAEIYNARSYLETGDFAIFEGRKFNEAGQKYWPFFITSMLRLSSNTTKFKMQRFKLEQLWLLILAEPRDFGNFEVTLTKCMAAKGFPLCKNAERLPSATEKIKAAIGNMNTILSRTTMQVALTWGEELSKEVLHHIEVSMINNLESMKPGSEEHTQYLAKVREIISHITSYASRFHVVSPYFTTGPSRYYWPDESDPLQFSSTLAGCCNRLYKLPVTSSSYAFHFLCGSWQAHLQSSHLDTFAEYVSGALMGGTLVKFMFADFFPIVIEASFRSHCYPVWITLIEPIAMTSEHVLGLEDIESMDITWNSDENKRERADLLCGTIFKILMDISNKLNYQGINIGTITACHLFWMRISPILRVYLQTNDLFDRNDAMQSISRKLNWFAAIGRSPATFVHSEFCAVDTACGEMTAHCDKELAVKQLIGFAEKGWRTGIEGNEMIVRTTDGRSQFKVGGDANSLLDRGFPDLYRGEPLIS